MRKLIAGTVLGSSALLTLATVVYANGYDYYSYSSDLANTSAAAGTAVIGAFLVPLCCGLIMLVINIAMAVYVYKDANKVKADNAVIWALLTFFFSFIGLLVYILAIKPEAVKKMEAMKGGDMKHEMKSEDAK